MSILNRLLSIRFWEESMRGPKRIFFCLFLLGIIILCWTGTNYTAWDFVHRYRMGYLILHGIDPVDVVRNPEVSTNANLPESIIPLGFSPYHIDFPWTQSMSALFGILKPNLSLAVFRLLQVGCLIFCMAASIHYLIRKYHIERMLAAMLVSLFFLASYVRTDIKVGNTALISFAGVFILYYGWEKKKAWLEAIGMTLLCLKPQTGFLFVLLLLLERHFLALFLTGVFCLVISIPEMLCLHKIPWDFLRSMFAVKFVFTVEPQTLGLFCVLYQVVPQKILMGCDLLASTAVLGYFWWRCPSKDPMVRMLPAVVGTLFWTYSRTYHFILWVIPLLCLAGLLKAFEEDRKNICITLLLMALLWLPVQQYLPTYVFLFKYVLSVIAIFYISKHTEKSVDGSLQPEPEAEPEATTSRLS